MVGRDVVALLLQRGDSMPYTIVDDGDEICIRAVITQRWELAELVTKLQQRVDGKPTNITTMIGEGHRSDAQDVNRKELSNE
jgi:hypothetical protein